MIALARCLAASTITADEAEIADALA